MSVLYALRLFVVKWLLVFSAFALSLLSTGVAQQSLAGTSRFVEFRSIDKVKLRMLLL
jgi:hypothetical protein